MDNSPTSLFESYEQDFRQLIDSVREKVEGDGKEHGEAKKAALRRVEMELDEADEMISQMEIEIQGMPTSIKPQYSTRIKSAKTELSRYKKLAKELHAQSNRAALLSDVSGSPFRDSTDDFSSSGGGGSKGDRARLLAGTALLEDGSRRLLESQNIALETERQGADILTDLRRQREQIENSRDTLRTADLSIDRASGTLKKMIRRMYQQRVVTAAIIAVLLLLIGIIIYEKLSR